MPLAAIDTPASPRIMGILNTTPDSFSDGGRYLDPVRAIQHGLAMYAEGADIIDIGGESTRPGAPPVPPEEQLQRVIPVIRGLRERLPATVPISIDTTSAQVAHAALTAGADWINDTSAGTDDPELLPLAAEQGTPVVLMHRRGRPVIMQQDPRYEDVTREVCDALSARAASALAAGIPPDRILLDPGIGIGFGKLTAHNLELLAGLNTLVQLGFPLLLGASRKRFMREICGTEDHAALTAATCAVTALGVMTGVAVFRVHDVAANRRAADLAWAVRQAAFTHR